MGMQTCPDGAVLVELPAEPETSRELENVIRCVQEHSVCDVVLDFSNVTILTSRSLSPLLLLQGLLASYGQRLVLCCIGLTTSGILSVTALDTVFEIVDDRDGAFAALQAPSNSLSEPDTSVSHAVD